MLRPRILFVAAPMVAALLLTSPALGQRGGGHGGGGGGGGHGGGGMSHGGGGFSRSSGGYSHAAPAYHAAPSAAYHASPAFHAAPMNHTVTNNSTDFHPGNGGQFITNHQGHVQGSTATARSAHVQGSGATARAGHVNSAHHNGSDHFHHFDHANHFHHRNFVFGYFPGLFFPFFCPGFYPFYSYPFYLYPNYYSDLYYPDYYTPGYYSSFYDYAATPSYLDTTVRLPEEYAPPMPPADGAAALADATVHLTVRVPADAEIWVDGAATQQGGSVRKFVSPPLTAGGEYTYELKARWMDNGREVVQTRRIPVSAGARRTVDFSQPEAEPIAPPKSK